MTDITTPFPATPHKLGLYPSSTAWNGSLVCWRPALATIQLVHQGSAGRAGRRGYRRRHHAGSAHCARCSSTITGGWRS